MSTNKRINGSRRGAALPAAIAWMGLVGACTILLPCDCPWLPEGLIPCPSPSPSPSPSPTPTPTPDPGQPGVLVSLNSAQGSYILRPSPPQSVQLQITGEFSDGSTEDLTPAATGTAYSTTDMSVSTVSDDGLVTSVDLGEALITVENSGETTTIRVRVVRPGGGASEDDELDDDDDGVPNDQDRCPGFDDNLDEDGDGVPDGCDECPGTPACADPVDAVGCPTDSDNDGVVDGCDECPGTPACADPVDAVGCPTDSDNDGVVDGCDECPETPECADPVDAVGCPTDSDGDGVVDGCDECPETPECADPVDAIGCPTDSDGDGVVDGCDECPETPECADPVDAVGCPTDSDDDGLVDGCDPCPDDPNNECIVGPTLISAASIKTHGEAGSFAIPLDISGDPANATSEPRMGGPTTVTLTFSEDLLIEIPQDLPPSSWVIVTGAQVNNVFRNPANTVRLLLTPDSDETCIEITMAPDKLEDADGNDATGTVYIRALEADHNNDGIVTELDAFAVVGNGGPVHAGNARFDFNLDGEVSGSTGPDGFEATAPRNNNSASCVPD